MSLRAWRGIASYPARQVESGRIFWAFDGRFTDEFLYKRWFSDIVYARETIMTGARITRSSVSIHHWITRFQLDLKRSGGTEYMKKNQPT